MQSVTQKHLVEMEQATSELEAKVRDLKRDDPGLELDDEACKLMRDQPEAFRSYEEACAHVLKFNESLAARYAASFVTTPRAEQFADNEDAKEAGSELDRLALALLKRNDERGVKMTYDEACKIVLRENPELGKRYGGKHSRS